MRKEVQADSVFSVFWVSVSASLYFTSNLNCNVKWPELFVFTTFENVCRLWCEKLIAESIEEWQIKWPSMLEEFWISLTSPTKPSAAIFSTLYTCGKGLQKMCIVRRLQWTKNLVCKRSWWWHAETPKHVEQMNFRERVVSVVGESTDVL